MQQAKRSMKPEATKKYTDNTNMKKVSAVVWQMQSNRQANIDRCFTAKFSFSQLRSFHVQRMYGLLPASRRQPTTSFLLWQHLDADLPVQRTTNGRIFPATCLFCQCLASELFISSLSLPPSHSLDVSTCRRPPTALHLSSSSSNSSGSLCVRGRFPFCYFP